MPIDFGVRFIVEVNPSKILWEKLDEWKNEFMKARKNGWIGANPGIHCGFNTSEIIRFFENIELGTSDDVDCDSDQDVDESHGFSLGKSTSVGDSSNLCAKKRTDKKWEKHDNKYTYGDWNVIEIDYDDDDAYKYLLAYSNHINVDQCTMGIEKIIGKKLYEQKWARLESIIALFFKYKDTHKLKITLMNVDNDAPTVTRNMISGMETVIRVIKEGFDVRLKPWMEG